MIKPQEIEFELQDRVSIEGVKGWVRMKLYTDPKVYRVQTERELLPETTADQLTLIERYDGERATI